MARLIYSALASLDGYVADEDGRFEWAAPDEEVHAAVNDLMRQVGTQLLGRRMYEVLVYWETVEASEASPAVRDFAAMWRATEKVVYSRTLEAPSSARTRVERAFDPEEVRRMKAGRTGGDISVGGPGLAGEAIRAGLVDEVHLFLAPVLVGGGTRALPDGVRVGLELLDSRRFGGGVVHLRYRVS